ncbi:hypothetical protein FG386_000700 [Cryptosporidium ryanae]|uniref:uncharacterized protein n=1 Tax=Cryptosporidium ryanae TaxID=515981 RepID=UPI00351A14A2|nr:hypothetical protein FG386_000700 [Cryptosporidium ryanae]
MGDTSLDREQKFRNYKLSLALKIKDKLECTGRWDSIVLDWSSNFNRYLISAQEILFQEDCYLRFETIIPLSYLDSIDCETFLKILREDEEIKQATVTSDDRGLCSSKVRHKFSMAIIGPDNQVILNSINFGLPKL